MEVEVEVEAIAAATTSFGIFILFLSSRSSDSESNVESDTESVISLFMLLGTWTDCALKGGVGIILLLSYLPHEIYIIEDT